MRRCVVDGGSGENRPPRVRRAHLRCADMSLTAVQEKTALRGFGGRISRCADVSLTAAQRAALRGSEGASPDAPMCR
ncbi:hypothetical protein HRbin17_00159 [bacterium HR17]|uniref:Uncharacterized protein n=1 Tax=Candidatus Fervidibacter japonicus TaxID=2035412 RepID=A0A2H5X900_9BACT|nr:hypothetical protein HRbin17_00159 [bacterium HR17]